MKAKRAADVRKFTDIPNIGPAMMRDFMQLGMKSPEELKGQNALKMYESMCRISGTRQDPCVLDTYLAAVDFMNGAPPRPWWHYTEQRKKRYPAL